MTDNINYQLYEYYQQKQNNPLPKQELPSFIFTHDCLSENELSELADKLMSQYSGSTNEVIVLDMQPEIILSNGGKDASKT